MVVRRRGVFVSYYNCGYKEDLWISALEKLHKQEYGEGL